MSGFDTDALLALIRGRVDERRAAGIVVGVLESDGTRRIAAYGDPGPGALPLGPQSVFEIGSITKVFTGILLADMAARGEVDPDGAVQRYGPAGLVLPNRDGREITFKDLASHRSGLPRLPANFAPRNRNNPYAEFSVAQMYEFLAGYQLPRAIGSQYEYSNLGAGLLGHVLAARAGVDYETLVRSRILDPLGMTMTGVALSPAMAAQLAIGHDAQGTPTSLWDFPTLAGAGALRSNMNDMLIFLAANIGEPAADLERAMRVSHRSLGAVHGIDTGFAWHLLSIGHSTIVCHNGGTGGYRSLIGFNPVRQIGVALLTNSAIDADDIALHLLNRAMPLRQPRVVRTAIDVRADVLARYVGEYQFLRRFNETVTIAITFDGDGLAMDATGTAKVRIFAESETRFFAQASDGWLTFVTDASGTVSGLILHQRQSNRTVRKVR